MNAPAAIKVEDLPEMVLTRIFHAPRSLVWRAFTEPEQIRKWWGPHHFTAPRAEVDLRVGGKLRIDMKGPDGSVFPMTGLYKEIREPETLVFLDSAFEDEKGVPGFEALTTISFAENAGQTTVTVRTKVLVLKPEFAGAYEGMEEGWSQQLERLGHHVGSLILTVPDKEPVLWTSRIFDAPRELVWKAMTEAEHLRHWWGPRAMETIHCEIDARPGGHWRIHQRVAAETSIGGTPEGTVLKFHGRIIEAIPPEKLVQTFGMEGEWGGEEIVEEITLTDIGDGRTLYKAVSHAKSFEDRAAALATGMTYGAQEMFDRLDEYLPRM
ncbi:MAG: SRPBCC domain-containing protein [Bauldia sp.]